MRDGRRRAGTGRALDEADPEHRVERHEEAVGREGEEVAGLTEAPEVSDGQDEHAREHMPECQERE